MAKLTGPLFSVDARGSISGTLTYSIKRNMNFVQSHLMQPTRIVTKNRLRKSLFELAIYMWKLVTDEQKQDWNNYAQQNFPDRSGYNCFVSAFVLACESGQFPSMTPP